MFDLTVEIHGKTTSDLVEALRETLRLVDEGYLSGSDSNDDGEYYFNISGEKEKLPSEIYSPETSKKILSAAKKHFHKRKGIGVIFEHGHYWISLQDGSQYS